MIYQSRYAAALNGRFKTESISHDPFEGVFTAPVLINITGADNYAYSISENHKFFRLNPLHKSSSSKRISFVPSNCFTHSHRLARVFLSLKFDRWVNEPDPPPPSSLPSLSSLLLHEAFPVRTLVRGRIRYLHRHILLLAFTALSVRLSGCGWPSWKLDNYRPVRN